VQYRFLRQLQISFLGPQEKPSFGAWVSAGRLDLSHLWLCCCDVRQKAASSYGRHVFRGEESRERRQDSTEMQSLWEPDQGSLTVPFALVNLQLTSCISKMNLTMYLYWFSP